MCATADVDEVKWVEHRGASNVQVLKFDSLKHTIHSKTTDRNAFARVYCLNATLTSQDVQSNPSTGMRSPVTPSRGTSEAVLG